MDQIATPDESDSPSRLTPLPKIPKSAIAPFKTMTRESVLSKLSVRERDVFWLLSHGHCNKIIAAKLGLAESTIKFYMSTILRILGCTNRTQAALVALAVREGIPLNRI